MRLFQNAGLYPTYFYQRRAKPHDCGTFERYIASFLDCRYGAIHFLDPILKGADTAFFTNGDDELVQRIWARENGMSTKAALADILLCQIESHRTEVFYNLDPTRYGSAFVRRLPGCVRKTIAWRNIPSPKEDFSEYDLLLCNSANMLKSYQQRGWKAEYFSPAHDPIMDEYARNDERAIDLLFVGGYSRHHMGRAAVLEAVAKLRDSYRVIYCLACSRLTRLAESPMGYLTPLNRYRRPNNIRAISREPAYGRDMYALLSTSKIVLNGTIDTSGEDRGNMRCFEAMGCKSLLLSDDGVYPTGMVAGQTMITYHSSSDVVSKLRELLQTPQIMSGIANTGYKMVTTQYSKKRQWNEFRRLVGTI